MLAVVWMARDSRQLLVLASRFATHLRSIAYLCSAMALPHQIRVDDLQQILVSTCLGTGPLQSQQQRSRSVRRAPWPDRRHARCAALSAASGQDSRYDLARCTT